MQGGGGSPSLRDNRTNGMLHFGGGIGGAQQGGGGGAPSAAGGAAAGGGAPPAKAGAAPPAGAAAAASAAPSCPAAAWTIEEVCAWAASVGLPEPCVSSLRRGRVDGAALLELESDEVRDELAFPIGDRKRLLREIKALRETKAQA